MTLKLVSTQVVETSVTNTSPSQDCTHPDDLFQSRYVTPGFKPFSYENHFPVSQWYCCLDDEPLALFCPFACLYMLTFLFYIWSKQEVAISQWQIEQKQIIWSSIGVLFRQHTKERGIYVAD